MCTELETWDCDEMSRECYEIGGARTSRRFDVWIHPGFSPRLGPKSIIKKARSKAAKQMHPRYPLSHGQATVSLLVESRKDGTWNWLAVSAEHDLQPRPGPCGHGRRGRGQGGLGLAEQCPRSAFDERRSAIGMSRGTCCGRDTAELPSVPPPVQPSQKSFAIKKRLAKKARQNRPIAPWFRLKTNNKIRCVAARLAGVPQNDSSVGVGVGLALACWGGQCWERGMVRPANTPAGLHHSPARRRRLCPERRMPSVLRDRRFDREPVALPPRRYNAKRRHWRRTKIGI